MGGIISSLVEIIVLATELSAASGLTIEALLTGEALAALEAEVFSLMTIEGLSGIEALAQLGWTAEQFSNLAYIASTFSTAVGYGIFFQTASGLSSLIAAGIQLGLQVSTVNRGRTERELELLFGTAAKLLHGNLAHHLNPFQWCESLHRDFPKEIEKVDISLRSKLGLIIENGRWVIQTTPTENTDYESGNIVNMYGPPGGANQRVTPDWLLHLILRLNGAQEKSPLCN
ncbi:viral protein 2 [Alphapolyomavirus callosciuri]|uniref:Minor capsid protein VP2 n=1 Tax=Alphapolyomavirus callosciuri TaxID=2721748 RepID=A0A6G9LUF7_9POLY|nr:viral protein 2 [Alphapolyomavirus callosciuri]QIQ69319.1 viral protein 2 [Alphapolyomavirus callosciuri]QIQ69324.1 viral protein 2 [Alphapolyomavirus callosciuri]QIQ69327.1 viral protein 2 [Alphapolyomavirus callosciuri]